MLFIIPTINNVDLVRIRDRVLARMFHKPSDPAEL